MKKKIISLGLLATVLSFTSCVKDNESDSVVAQRQAQTEKLKAEANKNLVEAKLKEQETLLKQLEVARTDAFNKLELAERTEQNKVTLKTLEAGLVSATTALNEAQEIAKVKLENLKYKLIDERQSGVVSFTSTVNKRFSEYTGHLENLADEQKKLITEKQALANLETGVVTMTIQKEMEVKAEKRKIAADEKRIKFIKQWPTYADVSTIDAKYAEAKEKYDKAKEDFKVKSIAFTDVDNLVQNEYSKTMPWNATYFKVFEAKQELYKINPDFIVISQNFKYKEVIVEKEDFTYSKYVYDVDYLPTINIDRIDLKLDDYTQNINTENKELDKLKKELDKAAKNKATRYSAYRKDANKKADYEQAVADYEKASEDVREKKKDIEKIENKKSELQGYKDEFTNADNQKAVKDFLVKLNKDYEARVEKYFEKKIADKIKLGLLNEMSDLLTLKRGAEKAEEEIIRLEKQIAESKNKIADLSNVQTQEQLIANKKAEIAKIEQRIELLKKEVEVAKKAYDEALAAL